MPYAVQTASNKSDFAVKHLKFSANQGILFKYYGILMLPIKRTNDRTLCERSFADFTYIWPRGLSPCHTVILYDAMKASPVHICTVFSRALHCYTSSNLICARSSDFLLYRMFCMQTGRMSGTRRSRLFWLCSVISWYLMSLHVSWCFSPFL